jgi:hypothetical protein
MLIQIQPSRNYVLLQFAVLKNLGHKNFNIQKI